MSNANHPPNKSKSLMEQGFELDKKLNRVAIVAGLGIAAVGAVIAAPAAVTVGALITGGSIVGLELNKRFDPGRKK